MASNHEKEEEHKLWLDNSSIKLKPIVYIAVLQHVEYEEVPKISHIFERR